MRRWNRYSHPPCRPDAVSKPPESLDGWLKPGWQSVETEAEVLESRNFPAGRRAASPLRLRTISDG